MVNWWSITKITEKNTEPQIYQSSSIDQTRTYVDHVPWRMQLLKLGHNLFMSVCRWLISFSAAAHHQMHVWVDACKQILQHKCICLLCSDISSLPLFILPLNHKKKLLSPHLKKPLTLFLTAAGGDDWMWFHLALTRALWKWDWSQQLFPLQNSVSTRPTAWLTLTQSLTII